jgi:trehalose utilization protein
LSSAKRPASIPLAEQRWATRWSCAPERDCRARAGAGASRHGFVSLHAAAPSKPTRRLLGTSCTFRWREEDDRELLWTVAPSHRIARGVPPVTVLPRHEMYGEPFDIPEPDEVVFISAFSGGEVFRSGCCYRRGAGRVFLFSPGHQTDPIYTQPEIRLILSNAVHWAAGDRVLGPPPSLQHSPSGWFENAGG